MRKQFAFVLAVTLGSIGVSFAQGGSQEEQQACMDDAYKFCGAAIPDRERVFYCLVQNKTAITPRYLAMLAPHIPPDPPPPVAKRVPKAKKKDAKNDGAPVNLNPR
jgi:hypothetical protein